ncbi:hypothetical protein GGD41_006802 [Paraburkholderia bryophila]|uniref:Uncharacterized protein n=1 Tax=Paraburkholderia bryophila TaxID=420952 RepID=A0A7Y9WEW4_9BURK|nr:hypothetical protein [Paraburkholderia bryophila]
MRAQVVGCGTLNARGIQPDKAVRAEEKDMKRSRLAALEMVTAMVTATSNATLNAALTTALKAGVALTLFGASGTLTFAQTPRPVQTAPTAQTVQTAQTNPPPQQDSNAPMAKPPEAASGAGGSSNPDSMPVKRPPKPTNDRMMRQPPASGANAK